MLYALVTTFLPIQVGHGIGCPVDGWSAGTAFKPRVRTATVCGQEIEPSPMHSGQVLISISPASLSCGALLGMYIQYLLL